ncbi:hypothetical protein GTP45_01290 [Pseudoduganella sp. FT55W]|uniref:Uncharacterized protein n=1 Tax=Duganella rivi TaxID=2666083 RepID=A0A7X4KA20_9BURK|nr:hypothetical protein [Duganella rivi]MYM65467.1 hypothetical protein [Duganella rivi]
METVRYMSLAALRNADREAFDGAIRSAVVAAAADVGREVLIKALCGPSRRNEKSQAGLKKAA